MSPTLEYETHLEQPFPVARRVSEGERGFNAESWFPVVRNRVPVPNVAITD